MKVYRYEDSLIDISKEPVPTVFLAGPTVRGNQPHLTSWRFNAIAEFEKQGFTGNLIVPEFTDITMSDKDKTWIPAWEFAGLVGSDINMYWLAKNRKKVVYGRPSDSYRNAYLDVMWDMDHMQYGPCYGENPTICDTLAITITHSIINATAHMWSNRQMSKVGVRSPYGVF